MKSTQAGQHDVMSGSSPPVVNRCTNSGAGLIFGATGGVMEAALRTAYHSITGKNLENDKTQEETKETTK